jgi:hypothetical protein
MYKCICTTIPAFVFRDYRYNLQVDLWNYFYFQEIIRQISKLKTEDIKRARAVQEPRNGIIKHTGECRQVECW